MGYSKLYSSIVNSSLWGEPDHIRLLFITLLAMADREGYVYGSKRGLERAANIEYDPDCQDDPWKALMSPDKESSDLMRNPENDGRRIEEVPGGFRLLNFIYYRSLRNEDDRREQNKEAQRKHRERLKVSQRQPASAKVSQHKPISDADADAEEEVSKASLSPPLGPSAEEIYKAYPLKKERPEALKAIKAAIPKHGAAYLLERTKAFATIRAGDVTFIPYPAKWFKREGFNDDPETWKPKDGPNGRPKPPDFHQEKLNQEFLAAMQRRAGK